MEKFDVNTVIEKHNIDSNELCKVLFPNVKYPKQAFDRVKKGEACLDTDQIQRLAAYIGVMPSELFTMSDWKGSYEDGCITLTKGEYVAKLNYKGTFVTLFKGTEVLKEEFTNVSSMPATDFIEYLNNLLTNNGNNDGTNQCDSQCTN